MIAKHGGRYLTKGGTHKVLEIRIGSLTKSQLLNSPT